MSYKQEFENIISILNSTLVDADKFDQGNDAAGKRLRATCQEVKNNLQNLRLQIQETRNSRKLNK